MRRFDSFINRQNAKTTSVLVRKVLKLPFLGRRYAQSKPAKLRLFNVESHVEVSPSLLPRRVDSKTLVEKTKTTLAMPPIQIGRLDSRHRCSGFEVYVDKELTCCATVWYGSEGTITKGIVSTFSF